MFARDGKRPTVNALKPDFSVASLKGSIDDQVG